MILKELIFHSFYIGIAVVVLKKLIFSIFYFGGCGGLERTDFSTVSTLGDVVVLKVIFNSFYSGSDVMS